MSLEQEIAELRTAILHLTAVMQKHAATTVTTSAPAVVVAAPVMAPVSPPAPTMPLAAQPLPVPVPPPAPAMPPPPSFLATPAPEATSAVPFNDPKGLIEYVMETYKKLGRDKGAQIGDVLTKMGLKAINEVQPSQYAEFYVAVEAIK